MRFRISSKSRRPRRMFQPAHPNNYKRRPRNLTAWYGVDDDIRMRTRILCAYKFNRLIIEDVYARAYRSL